MQKLTYWNPEDEAFWEKEGRKIANRNLWISIPALMLSFIVWMLLSVVAVNLNNAGFKFTNEQLFTLTALPGLSGATLRVFYSFVVPIFGGRNWTVISTASLLIPTLGIGYAVQDTSTSFTTMAILAMLCGFGAANFASSMGNISFFFPKRLKGSALGLNGGLGNLGVSVVQFVSPLVVAVSIFGSTGIHNAVLIWVVPIILTTIAAFFGMNNLETAKASLAEQAIIFKCKHNWVMTFLYTMAFGSFIGYSAVFPLLIKFQFPQMNPLQYAFLGPLVGALCRPVGGWLSDKIGGSTVTFWSFAIMAVATVGIVHFVSLQNFWAFFGTMLVLFVCSGMASGSTFGMIPIIFEPKIAAPALGFASAVGAFGAFFVPKSFGLSMQATGSMHAALYAFIIAYILCLVITWYYYKRNNAEMKC